MPRTSTSRSLHHCPNCSSELVQPVEWEPASEDSWSILLRCPECEVFNAGVFSQAEADVYDAVLERGQELVRAAYTKLASENMASEIDAFAGALHAGAILPEDF